MKKIFLFISILAFVSCSNEDKDIKSLKEKTYSDANKPASIVVKPMVSTKDIKDTIKGLQIHQYCVLTNGKIIAIPEGDVRYGQSNRSILFYTTDSTLANYLSEQLKPKK